MQKKIVSLLLLISVVISQISYASDTPSSSSSPKKEKDKGDVPHITFDLSKLQQTKQDSPSVKAKKHGRSSSHETQSVSSVSTEEEPVALASLKQPRQKKRLRSYSQAAQSEPSSDTEKKDITRGSSLSWLNVGEKLGEISKECEMIAKKQDEHATRLTAVEKVQTDHTLELVSAQEVDTGHTERLGALEKTQSAQDVRINELKTVQAVQAEQLKNAAQLNIQNAHGVRIGNIENEQKNLNKELLTIKDTLKSKPEEIHTTTISVPTPTTTTTTTTSTTTTGATSTTVEKKETEKLLEIEKTPLTSSWKETMYKCAMSATLPLGIFQYTHYPVFASIMASIGKIVPSLIAKSFIVSVPFLAVPTTILLGKVFWDMKKNHVQNTNFSTSIKSLGKHTYDNGVKALMPSLKVAFGIGAICGLNSVK